MKEAATESQPFSFIVEEVFYIGPPVDRVILVGTVREGTICVGDALTVHCQGADVSVTLDLIETIDRGPVEVAARGQQVGLRLVGIRRHQAARGDRVTRGGNH